MAYEPVPAYLGAPNLQNAIDARLDESHDILKEALDKVGQLTANVQDEIIEGPIADAIINVDRTRESDLIVMGSRGLGRWAGAVLGSNSQKVVSEAPCPVLIVH
ncbi:MAG: universal stress protein [Chloroflexi bacterium]|nr:universal stress protein [Chloroflexota bacterium]